MPPYLGLGLTLPSTEGGALDSFPVVPPTIALRDEAGNAVVDENDNRILSP